MKKIILLVLPVLVVLGFVAVKPSTLGSMLSAGDTTKILAPSPEHYSEAALVSAILNQHHYSKIKLDDSLSAEIFDNFINSFDNFHIYFLESDINSFEGYRYQLDDHLKEGNVDFAYEVYKVFRSRFMERMERINPMLAVGFDFGKKEIMDLSPPDKWLATEEEIEEEWRLLLKSQALNLKLAGKDSASIIETVEKRYERYKKVISQYKSEDIFQLYMNSLASSFDPHTSYFSPISAENFEIGMSLSLEGIGARLFSQNDYVTFSEILPGGPAFKSKKLNAGDRIVAVAQENDTTFVNIVGWRTDDAVQLIRGAKGTTVRLQVLPAEASLTSKPIEVKMVRDKIKLEDQAASQEIIPFEFKNKNYKIGVITIPSFYRNFEAVRNGEEDFKSTKKDVLKILEDFNVAGVDGVIVDLRRNGGGSLQEAVELTGLFIPEGPVVQVRNADNSVEILTDPDSDIRYDGPLAVVINRFSASASEIFAAAIQDYKRGIVVGEQTYGKGTVQSLIDLKRFLPEEKAKLGQLKLTLAKFYRVNGSSTQHLGVSPDIQMPSPFSAEEYGESSQPNALPWDQIAPTDYIASNYVSENQINALNKSYQKRTETDEGLVELIKNIEEIKNEREVNSISLNEEERRKEMEGVGEEGSSSDLSAEIESEEIPEPEKPDEINDVYLKQSIYLIAELISGVG
ncbi:carboxy terminal-processing peptidase [Flexithrix dorotheae]|uniref:carboxy terminal-processing peptidase n=1 Tax=Flexithrix dorotheae TaxID=70993 RepID=UPI0003685045|nr:carboxy terminal-processing peptidase [Flexithrix dorotheae]